MGDKPGQAPASVNHSAVITPAEISPDLFETSTGELPRQEHGALSGEHDAPRLTARPQVADADSELAGHGSADVIQVGLERSDFFLQKFPHQIGIDRPDLLTGKCLKPSECGP